MEQTQTLPTLLVLDQIQDSSIEKEFFPKNDKLGFTVKEYYSDGSMTQFNNVTEVHWLLDGNEERAYESDIHSTGSCWYFDREYKRVELVVVTDATERAGSY